MDNNCTHHQQVLRQSCTTHGLWYEALLHKLTGNVVASFCEARLQADGNLARRHTHHTPFDLQRLKDKIDKPAVTEAKTPTIR